MSIGLSRLPASSDTRQLVVLLAVSYCHLVQSNAAQVLDVTVDTVQRY